MSAHAYPTIAAEVPSRIAAIRARVAAHADVCALVVVAIAAIVLLLITWNTWGSVDNDTGYDALAGARVAHGQFPYVDYTYWYGPLAPFLLGFVSLLGGAGFQPAIVFGIAIALTLVGATYALGRALSGALGGLLAALLVAPLAFAPHQFSYVSPHTHSATLGVLTVVLSLLCLHAYAKAPGRASLIFAGVAAGLAGLTRPEFALAALLAGASFLATRTTQTRVRRQVAMFAVPALGIPAVVYAVFAGVVGPHRLVFENLYPRDFFKAAGNHMLHARTPFTASSFVTLAADLLLYVIGAALLVVVARSMSTSSRRRALAIAVVLVLTVAVAVSVMRPEVLRHGLKLAYAWVPAGAAVAALVLLRRRRRTHAAAPRDVLELPLVVALTVVAAATYAAFYAYSFSPQMAVYAMPLAAPFLVRLHLGYLARNRTGLLLAVVWIGFLAAAGIGLTLRDSLAESATIRGPGGAIAAKPLQAAPYRAAVSWIDASTRRGEPILLAPQLTWLYLVSERSNPLPELSLLPGALASPAGERAAIRRVDAAHVRLVITESRALSGYGHTAFGESFDRVLAGWIRGHFKRAAVLRGPGGDAGSLVVWSRRTS